jgi:hypothetical protein
MDGASTVAIIGGCFAQAMTRGLASALAACARYRFVELPVHLTSLHDPASKALIAEAGTIFAQQLPGMDWALLESCKSAGCQVFRFPNVELRSLWPFDCDYGYPDRVAQSMPNRGIWHFDWALARLRTIEPDPKRRLARYRALDFPGAGRADILAEAQRRFLARIDAESDFQIGAFISHYLADWRLFYNASHPSGVLFQALCSYCWQKLDLPGRAQGLTGIDSWREWSVPVHPGIARRLGVTWAHEGMRYSYRGLGEVTWSEWVEKYIDLFG